MHSTLSVATALAVIAGQALAVNHMVMTDGIAFSPSSVSNVAEGDEISVTFSTRIPHNIVSSTFAAPCTYNSAGGVASLTYKQGEVFTFSVKSTDPQFFFCSVNDHCNEGMVFAINPSSTETIEAASSAAENADIVPAGNTAAIGGSVGGASGGSSSAASSMAMSSAAMSSAAASSSMAMSMSSSHSMSMATSMPASSSMAGGAAASTSRPASSGMASGTSAGPSASTGGAAGGASVAMAGALLAGVAAFAL